MPDEISFGVRAPADAIRSDMQQIEKIVDDTVARISNKTARIRVVADQANAASAAGDGSGGGLVNSFIGVRTTIRAIEIGVHGVEVGLATWRIATANVNTDGKEILKNTESLLDAARALPIVSNILRLPIKAVEEAAKAAEKALQDELNQSKRIAEHTEKRQKNELAAEEQIRIARAKATGPEAEKDVRAQIEFERTQREKEAQFQGGLLSGETKDEAIKSAAMERDREIEKNRVDSALKSQKEILHIYDEFNVAALKAAGKEQEAERAAFVHSWDERLDEAFHKVNAAQFHMLSQTRDFAVQAFDAQQRKKNDAEEADFEAGADREAARARRVQEKIEEQQSTFEQRRIAKGDATLERINEARARTTFEAVTGSRTNFSAGVGGATIEDSIKVETNIRDELKLLRGDVQKNQIKVF